MRLLIAYATTSGQTRKIARFAADRFAGQGHAVELLNAEDTEGLDLARFDGAVLAGSLHTDGYQKALRRFVTEAGPDLMPMPTLFLAVSLSVAANEPEDWKRVTLCLEQFAEETGWIPSRLEHVAGAFRFSEYEFFRVWAMRWIANQKGEAVDATKNTEYTDWAALVLALDSWVSSVPQRVIAGAA